MICLSTASLFHLRIDQMNYLRKDEINLRIQVHVANLTNNWKDVKIHLRTSRRSNLIMQMSIKVITTSGDFKMDACFAYLRLPLSYWILENKNICINKMRITMQNLLNQTELQYKWKIAHRLNSIFTYKQQIISELTHILPGS